ncbi:MAG TPA: type VI secretion system contractile sheath large subunit [Marinagarivorans sp.]
MPQLTVQSNITHPQNDGTPIARQNGPLKVAVLGSFSGNGQHQTAAALLNRKHLRVTKDSFDDLFERLQVSLHLPIEDTQIAFDDIDDLNPDHIYQNVPAFKEYRELMAQLSSSKGFHCAVERLAALGIVAPTPAADIKRTAATENLLDSVLSNVQQHDSGAFSVDALIRQTIAPYIEKQPDPRAEHYIAAVENAAADLLRSILHASAFKQLEASWRGLDMVNRRLDTDRTCHLYLVDTPMSALTEDALSHCDAVEASALYRNLIDNCAVAGEKPYDIILIDALLDNNCNAGLLPFFTHFAQRANITVLAGTSTLNPDDTNLTSPLGNQPHSEPNDASAMQAHTGANNVFICTPPFMARLPYGRKTHPIESFAFEELPARNTIEYYVWSNSAYLLLMTFVEGNNTIASLPFHAYLGDDGEDQLVPPTGAFLPASAVECLETQGLTVAQSVKHSDSVMIQRRVSWARLE